jgi:hypothetical protein
LRVAKPRDIIIALVVLAVAVVPLILRDGSGKGVIVEVDGRVVMRITKPGRYDVYRKGKRITTVVFDGKRVRVENSTCPLKLCEKMGWVGPGGEIICVPNHLVVRFERGGVDAMTW